MTELRPAPALTDRRTVLIGLVGVAGTMVVACESPQMQQLISSASEFAVPDAQLRQMGVDTWHRIRAERPDSRDAGMTRRLNDIGSRVVSNSNTREPSWEFAVLQGNEINAFAVPGGKVAFYEGIFSVFRNDDQLAAVMGHEVAHINADHSRQRIAAAKAKQIGLQAVSIALNAGDYAYANEIAGLLGAGLQYGVILPFSRSHEYEADELGVRYMAQSGYDPREAVAFWSNMTRMSRGQKPPEFLSTHPSDENRVAEIQKLMPDAMTLYRQSRG